MSNSTHTEVVLAGAAAAFTVDLLIYPLDTLKTRIQSRDYLKTYASDAAKKSSSSAFRGLYQGIGIVIVSTLPAAGTFFTVYESSKTLYGSVLSSALPQPLIHSLASGTAELASCLVLTPAEVIKQNAQMISKSSSTSTGKPTLSQSTSLQAIRMISSAEGGALRRLWSGYTALAARNLPFTALQFPLFEAFRARLWKWRDHSRSKKQVGGVESGQGLWETGLVNGASASVSGALAATVTAPTDVVKTRMMLLGEGKDGEKTSKRASGVDVAKMVYREKGVKGLFRGGVMRAGWTAVGSGLYLGTYEMAKVWLRGPNAGDDESVL